MEATTERDSYLVNVLDVYGPHAVRLVAKRILRNADDFDIVHTYGVPSVDRCRAVVAGYVVDAEQSYLAECDPELWAGLTTEAAHEIRAAVIRDVADALRDELWRRDDEAYDRRMACRRQTNDCGCMTCGG